jgi:hypothetical protein
MPHLYQLRPHPYLNIINTSTLLIKRQRISSKKGRLPPKHKGALSTSSEKKEQRKNRNKSIEKRIFTIYS